MLTKADSKKSKKRFTICLYLNAAINNVTYKLFFKRFFSITRCFDKHSTSYFSTENLINSNIFTFGR